MEGMDIVFFPRTRREGLYVHPEEFQAVLPRIYLGGKLVPLQPSCYPKVDKQFLTSLLM